MREDLELAMEVRGVMAERDAAIEAVRLSHDAEAAFATWLDGHHLLKDLPLPLALMLIDARQKREAVLEKAAVK